MRATTSFIRRGRYLPIAAIASLALALAAVGITSSASAAAIPPGHASGQVIRTQLTLDCVHLSKPAHRYAVAHRYCSANGTGAPGPDSTGTSPPGDCGTSFISIVDLGGGVARFSWGFSSSLGTVAYRGLEVNWVNLLFSNSSGWPDNAFMWSSGYSSIPKTVGTGEGNVFGDVSGYVVLWWGGTCDLLTPSTTQNIT